MAEITGFTGKRRSPRIDMTAMVDVAFLLLSFFVLTAAISTQKMMRLTMPPPDALGEVDGRKVMTLRIFGQNEVEYYVGLDSLNKVRVNVDNIRPAILQHLDKFLPICSGNVSSDCWDPIFLIQAKDEAMYGTLVDVLDEMAILGAKKYAIDYD